MAKSNGPERVRSTIKGSIQVAIWDDNATLTKGWKPKNSDEWQNIEMKLFPEEIEAAIEVLEIALETLGGSQPKKKPSRGFEDYEDEKPARSQDRPARREAAPARESKFRR